MVVGQSTKSCNDLTALRRSSQVHTCFSLGLAIPEITDNFTSSLIGVDDWFQQPNMSGAQLNAAALVQA